MNLITERLVLRPWREEDDARLFELAKDPAVGLPCGWPPHQSREESLQVIRRVLSGRECYAICLRGADIPIGSVELMLNRGTGKECELGFWLGRAYWGKGYMTEAAGELLRRGFCDLGVEVIHCTYSEGNLRSGRVQQKLGFIYSHTQANVPVPLLHESRTKIVNRLTKEQWEASRYRITSLSQSPELAEQAAKWYSDKWGIPEEAYLESIREPFTAGVPAWYVCLKGQRIVGGLGVIANDFHQRKDLTPNICAVYTEESERMQGIACRLLNRACDDLARNGIDTVYLLTDLEGFYERCGWAYFCMAKGDGEETPSRMYVHHQQATDRKLVVHPVTPDLQLVPYYEDDALTLPWYQDVQLVKQMDNRDEPYTAEQLHAMYTYLSQMGDCYYIVYRGIPVGDVTLLDRGEVCIAISREYQNRHIGRKCIRKIIALARQKGMTTLRATIYDGNLQSRNMFLACGFVKCGEQLYEYRLDTPVSVQIRPVEATSFPEDGLDDFVRFQKVRRIYRLENGQLGLYPCSFTKDWDRDNRRAKTEEIRSGGFMTLCAYDGDRVVGEAMLLPELDHGRLLVDSFQVSADCRRMGIGRQLFEAAMNEARKRGASALYFSAYPAEETILFYQAMGCSLSGHPILFYTEEKPEDIQIECPVKKEKTE